MTENVFSTSDIKNDRQLAELESALNAANELKEKWLKNKWAAAGAPSEEQAAKRTNEEGPPGGSGHVYSNNGGAGIATSFFCLLVPKLVPNPRPSE